MADEAYRTERDSMGDVRVPAAALYGAQTQRAVENFPISNLRFPRSFLRALGMIKRAAAAVNLDLGLLEAEFATAIQQAAKEVEDGLHDADFPLDIFQTGSGTSTNMNATVIGNVVDTPNSGANPDSSFKAGERHARSRRNDDTGITGRSMPAL